MLRQSGTWHGGDIRLIACSSGARPDGVAQQLADILGVRVLAPTETVWVDPPYSAVPGKLTVGMEYSKSTGDWAVFMPRE